MAICWYDGQNVNGHQNVWHSWPCAPPPGWPLCKRPGMTLIEVSQHAYLPYQAFGLSLIYHHVYFATWCTCLNMYLCWIKFCLSLSLSLSQCPSLSHFPWSELSTAPNDKLTITNHEQILCIILGMDFLGCLMLSNCHLHYYSCGVVCYCSTTWLFVWDTVRHNI